MSLENDVGSNVMSVRDWFITMVVLALPLVNVVAYLYWAFADGINPNKRNFCRAGLLWMVVVVGLFGLIAVFGGFAMLLNQ